MMITAISTPSTKLVTAAIAMVAPLTGNAPTVNPPPQMEQHPSDGHEAGSYIGASWLGVSAIELATRPEDIAADLIAFADRRPQATLNPFVDGSYAVGGSVSVGSSDATRRLNSEQGSSTSQKIADQEKKLQSAFAVLYELLPHADPALVEDAAPFYDLIKDMKWQPKIWSDDGEVAFEWKQGQKHAIVSFDGDGGYGYAMLAQDRFRAGSQNMPAANTMPSDLKDYLDVA